MEDVTAPRRLYPALAAAAVAFLVMLGTIGLSAHADVASAFILFVLLLVQLRTGYAFDRLATPGAKRSSDPVGYWVGVGLTALFLVAALTWALGRRELLPLVA